MKKKIHFGQRNYRTRCGKLPSTAIENDPFAKSWFAGVACIVGGVTRTWAKVTCKRCKRYKH